MIVNKNSESLSLIMETTFNYLKAQYSGGGVGTFPSLINKSTGIEFDLDIKSFWGPEVSSRLLDFLVSYSRGEDLDLGEMKDYIYESFNFSKRDKILLNKLNFEERLWAIVIVLSNPSHDYFDIKKG